ncbi:MAG: hypothetical protein HZC41_13365 [Chloroflexi bacterium]|nr:hypothetical protein [Chloroflexota bacterium]
MFWGWYSVGDGGMRRGGCFFLPLLFLCGSFFLFDNFNGGWLLPMIVVALLWLALPALLNRGAPPGEWDGEVIEGEKPKRGFSREKRKRDAEYLHRDDGEVLEVIEPPEDDDRRPNDAITL